MLHNRCIFLKCSIVHNHEKLEVAKNGMRGVMGPSNPLSLAQTDRIWCYNCVEVCLFSLIKANTEDGRVRWHFSNQSLQIYFISVID